jgi:dihydroorotase
MNHELVLEGKAFVNHEFQQCCIGIDDGKITEIKKILKGEAQYTYSKELLLPSGIDVHVHFREPGFIHKETFETGSIAAAFGGVSCVFDMPNTHPASVTPEALVDKQKIANRKSIVDFGLYAGISKDIVSKKYFADRLSSACHGFKLFLGETTHSLTMPSDFIEPVLAKIKPHHKPVFVHAEDEFCLQKHKRLEHNLSDHHTARPPHCEAISIEKIVSAAEQVETPVHICHVSSKEALHQFQENFSYVTYGITPHHSLLNLKYDKVLQSWLKVNPPIRTKKDQEQLFENVKNGKVFLLESDHAPHTLKEKEVDFSEAPSGIPGVETMLPLFLALAEKQQLTYQRVISLLSEHPAQLLQLSKGFIAKG